ncbi:hypothetical protein Lepto7376_3880 [[Leptolyngbya] sp. PCC 7376]|uniref:DNA N-6-adenine-methyltransferase n=1 Tax=[Leptolyngbya] sp. PCC 7376 TaxID=111781 RepID=UPI00029F208A|nr:DNA N-6-adenine-methyltransferase [[Leptolyngbya] sp. PCC 7376]AFY40036.1 hypothetical protein Lepto7376_3880 [[Leptolyngbya] sp. PCC 7376]
MQKFQSKPSDQRYTRSKELKLVYDTLQVINLDPTADPDKRVDAMFHITEQDDCLTTDWTSACSGFPSSQIYMNPPYSNSHPFIARLCEYLQGYPDAVAITLTHASLIQTKTSQHWFKKYARAICLPNHRINFDYPEGMKKKNGNDRDSLWTYWGGAHFLNRFTQVYANEGLVMEMKKA